MPFSDHELDMLRAESRTHRMALHGQLRAEIKRRTLRRRILLIVALILASIALLLTTASSWTGFDTVVIR